jgi:hypothetical protein
VALITSPDAVASATVTMGNQEQDGSYPILITGVAPVGQHYAIEVNGVRVYEENASAGSGTEG